MKIEVSDEGLSLEEKRYLASLSLSLAFKYAIIVCISTIIIISLALVTSTIMFNDEIKKYGRIIEETQGDKIVDVFLPDSGEKNVSVDLISSLYSIFKGLQTATGFTAFILIALFGWMLKRVRGDYNRLQQLDKEYIRQSYILNFEIKVPKGDSREERILNHLMFVFPQLKKLQRKWNKKGIDIPYQVNQDVNGYNANLLVNMPNKTGQLIIKFFDDKVRFEDIKELTKHLKKSTIFRVVCVANEYDDSFRTDEIENKMNQLSRDFAIDLILESQKGYTTIWVD